MIQEPKCRIRKCKNFVGISQPDDTEMTKKVVCLAFPKGIPDDIAYGDNLHLEPIAGQDNDLTFKPKGDSK